MYSGWLGLRPLWGKRLGAALLCVGLALSACSEDPEDGFFKYRPCPKDGGAEATRLFLYLNEKAREYHSEVLESTPEHVRIRLKTSGSRGDDADDREYYVDLDEPLGDRAVIDDTSGEAVECEPLY